MTWRAAASEVRTSERTLRSWRRAPGRRPPRRGRLPLAVPVAERNEVLRFVHGVTGPAVGVPALLALFPKIPRAILADLLRRYRRVWRERYRRRGYRLTWHIAGRVWAMDHSQATHPVDGVHGQIFALRDLASRRQLAWEPVRSTGSDEVRPILAAQFVEHGAPLVLKSDNGSAFQAGVTRNYVLVSEIQQLFSPAGYPQYNGQLERSNSTNKTYTHQHAIAEGHPHQWRREDLDAARELSNTISRPWGARGPSPDEAWKARPEITPEERALFAAEVNRQRLVARRELGVEEPAALPRETADEVDRRAIGRALEALGYLTREEQKRPPRRKRRPRRARMEAELRKLRESETQGAETGAPPADGDSIMTLAKETPPSATRSSPRADSNSKKLASSPRADTMPEVIDACRAGPDSRPPNRAAHRERPHSSWWRTTITLLKSIAKAAMILR